MHPGLSVSHDSIFHSPNSGSELELEEAQSSSSLSIQHHPTQTELRLQTELSERLRLRRGRGDTSEDDEGLPRSPCCNSPTATEGLLEKTAVKNHPTKSHSTCSDGSLLSMGSSEIEEDSFGQQSSRHSSKLSLYEKKQMDQDSIWELGPSSASEPLNHSAAHHRVSVRPKRTHGAPRRKRIQPMSGTALPTTPEVNEDSSLRSLTPETSTKETVTELYSSSVSMSKTRTESQLKCSSLPPGLAGPGTESSKLNRSRSSAGSKSQDTFTALGEEDEDKDEKKSDHSIFARLFPRRSGKKKKSKQENVVTTTSSLLLSYSRQTVESNSFDSNVTKFTDKRPYNVETKLAPRSGPASRQRVQPIDIPATPEALHRELETSPLTAKGSPPDKPASSTSPLHMELENHFRQRMAPSLSTSPPKFSLPDIESPPQSPKSTGLHSPLTSSPLQSAVFLENIQYTKSSNARYFESTEDNKSKVVAVEEKLNPIVPENKNKIIVGEDIRNRIRVSEESKSKVKIAGLSSLQQRVLSHNDDTTDTPFKSLTDFTSTEQTNSRLVTKSHSFKSNKSNDSNSLKDNRYTYTSSIMSKSDIVEKKSFTVEHILENNILKTASLDSMKVMEPFEDNKELIRSESSESLESGSSAKTSSTEYLDSLNPSNGITISGPSHTSVVSVSTSRDAQIVDSIIKAQPFTLNLEKDLSEHNHQIIPKELFLKEEQTFKEQQISVTKIQVKRESTQISQNVIKSNNVPEFLNIHLNKVDTKPATNVVLTANLSSPKLDVADSEGNKPKTVFNFDQPMKTEGPENPMRKFSQDDIEVIDKDINEEIVEIPSKNVSTPSTPNVIITSMTPPTSTRMYKKHSEVTTSQYSQLRKSSLVSVTDTKAKISLRTKSNSLDIVDSLKQSSDLSDKSKMSSVTDLNESVSSDGVVLRKKSLPKQKQDDEPELMKVFARRSLKLKDADDLAQQVLVMVEDSKAVENSDSIMSKSRDSDKENHLDSPSEERKKLIIKEQDKPKEPLVETKFVETTEVALRKPINNKLFAYQQRTISLNIPKTNEVINTEKVQKNNSFADRPKTEITEKVTNKTWITSLKKEPDSKDDKIISRDEVITEISSKSDFINEDFPTIPKNFNQRKAEWEKRAQEALKKSVP
ncbi:hypothetical protein ILUMI_12062 [Ignelater luminosus]|uniref:DUF4592 domain-containing protein n=1 Tax=Ignelater luminosus TaxID=2038154 RepID=A0A8K0CYX5_IGNLU|nr:hypothetical protein ILUMI_12062 [Ignelater luminosus]